MSDIYIQGESLHVDNKVKRVKIEGINETFESLNPKILRVGEGGGGASALNDLTDVEISTPTSGQILKYDEQNDKWVNGEEFLAPAIYSTDEREVGVWIDGKPLYQKTWVFQSVVGLPANGTWYDTNITADYIEKIVRADGCREDTNYVVLIAGLNQSNHIVLMQTRADGAPNFKLFTLRYTKTTDTPGSGTWTPSGIPAVHYDGNEKVIGTWFGETLYEKTLTATFASYNDTTVELLFTGLSLNKIIDAKGILIPSDHPDNTVVINKNSINGLIFSSANNEHIVVTRGGVGYWGATPTVKITIQYTKTT